MRILVKSEEVKSKNPERFRIQDFLAYLAGLEWSHAYSRKYSRFVRSPTDFA